MKLYKITIVHELQLRDPEMQFHICNWILQNVNDGIIDPRFIFFLDKAWFHLNGYVMSRNNRYWCQENP
ncbi:hypothetical protein C0J52_08437 [Blattella germanica]|nr:hypothetical protein C0J52_08437 [Blattella germanica]